MMTLSLRDETEALRSEDEQVLVRRTGPDGRSTRLMLTLVSERPTPASLDRLEHEYALRDQLDPAWAARPVARIRSQGRPALVFDDPGGNLLARDMGRPWAVGPSLRLAIGLAVALDRVHDQGLIHKDIKPANIFTDATTGTVWLTGFGIASPSPREHRPADAAVLLAGTLAYMAPEQTGRMNRSVDSRSDLYAFGVTLHEVLTGVLPFKATNPIEWIHCHIAKQPIPLHELVRGIPEPISAIVMKLLAKAPEDRYQTARGVESDLRRCLAEWESLGRIESFALGARDASERLLVPEKLYGREREIASLTGALARVVADGTRELVLVAGYAGVGKSSVVNELRKVLIPARVLFASGKADQYRQDTPYAPFAQALQSVLRMILSRSEAELIRWRESLRQALGSNGQLIVNFIPELELIVGKQPPVADLLPSEAKNRFYMVFRRFLGVIARPEHPLALFLDDLQWLDAATLDLLEHLASHEDVRHVLFVGAYRDNEVGEAHALAAALERLAARGSRVTEIELSPLGFEDFAQLLADALVCDRERARPLARLVHEKTSGNPFFGIQFITALYDGGLVSFDAKVGAWAWDLTRIRARNFTDNLVDLMMDRFAGLPVATRDALKELACLGNGALTRTLNVAHGAEDERVHGALLEAVRSGLVFHSDGVYSFLHDRVQEASYALIHQDDRAAAHLKIGRHLLSNTPHEKREEAIFDIVTQLNSGSALIASQGEREQLARLNLDAGRRARASTACASALKYLAFGSALLPEDRWERCHELAFALQLDLAECELLSGERAAAEARLSMLSERAPTPVDLAAVVCVQIHLYTTTDRFDRAVEICLGYLRHVGIEWSLDATDDDVRREYDSMRRKMGGRPIEALLDLPPLSDPHCRATMDVLAGLTSPAYLANKNLFALVVLHMVHLSMEHGSTDGSALAYSLLGPVLGPRFGNYRDGYRFGRLSVDLMEKCSLDRFSARVYVIYAANVIPWTTHLRTSHAVTRRAFEAALDSGDLTYASYCGFLTISDQLACGDPLAEVQRHAERGLGFARNARFTLIVDYITTQLGLIRTLRGLTPTFGSFSDADFDEGEFERGVGDMPLALTAAFYWIRKLQARFHAGRYAEAVEAASKAHEVLWLAPLFIEEAELHFYSALSHAAVCSSSPVEARAPHLEKIAEHHRQLARWAEDCAENFGCQVALVAAEIARLEGRELDAERLYEKAIRLAREHEFGHNEAISNELAARFHLGRGFETIAHAYLREARDGYNRWGALGKVQQLEGLHPRLRSERASPCSTVMLGAPEQLDVATVVKASQALSSEIVLDKLVEALMRSAVEHAGATRGALVMLANDEPRIEAVATTGSLGVVVSLRGGSLTSAHLPEAVLHYVVRTREIVILGDATETHPFSSDAYITRNRCRSVLCLPLVKQAKLLGVLYLENNLTAHAFTPDRIAVLTLLASQAAISLENAQLYAELDSGVRFWTLRSEVSASFASVPTEQLDAQIDLALRRIGEFFEVDSITIFWFSPTGEDAVATHLWARMGVAPLPGTVTLTAFPRSVAALRRGEDVPIPSVERMPEDQRGERTTLEQMGVRAAVAVPMVIGGVTIASTNFATASREVEWSDDTLQRMRLLGEVIANALARRRAGLDLERSEAALRSAQRELAHVTRMTTLGELAASIAHEVNQPLTAMVADAAAGLNWLSNQTPDLASVRESLVAIARDGARAGEVLTRIRALLSRSSVETRPCDLSAVVHAVLPLMRGQFLQDEVLLETSLATNLPAVMGDPIQLQQVVLNLVLNAVEASRDVDRERRRVVVRSFVEPSDSGPLVIVAVEDSGVGMSALSSTRLFETFYTTKPSGLGMGLSISRSIIDRHGGRLWAEANAGQGATFRFALAGIP